MTMGNYSFDQKKRFEIQDFDKANTFSSFLPGIAGVNGIPMWTFYVNRGQGITSFGVRDKHTPIMEFSPASIAYKTVATSGFRTFIKMKHQDTVYEAFCPTRNRKHIQRKMFIEANQLSIEEINQEMGLKVSIQYFHMPEANFAGLVRKVDITNLAGEPVEMEVMDGLPEILPNGVTNEAFKELGNLLRSWMEVYNVENQIPYYRVRASMGDEAEVSEIKSGHFYLSFSNDEQLISPIVDAELIFGRDTSLQYPERFNSISIEEIMKSQQVTANKVPCGFTPVKRVLGTEETMTICTIIGHVDDIERIHQQTEEIVSLKFIEQKQQLAFTMISELTNPIETNSGSEIFDEYCRQNYLDNLLRGGYPQVLENGDEGFVYHLFSRKHGDLERDYNFFSIAPEYYSQGNGNFRDANQNRRNDIYFNPKVGSFNAKMFMSLIQADGYNPLSVKGCSFEIKQALQNKVKELIQNNIPARQVEMTKLLQGKFTPGQVIQLLTNEANEQLLEGNRFLTEVLKLSQQNIEAGFGEGFWIDHWTYNLDLVESYLDIYPDRQEEFLFEDKEYTFFDSPAYVLPREEKYVLAEGKVRQYGSVMEDDEKMATLGIKINDTNWLKTKSGEGDIYRTNLLVKLVSLSLMKFSTLDPSGIGVEMEANKPGWNDALNGLPGLVGSGVGETFELKRLVGFILTAISSYQNRECTLPTEMATLLRKIYPLVEAQLNGELTDFDYWDQVSTLREAYRSSIRFGIDGSESTLMLSELEHIYQGFLRKIQVGIAKAEVLGEGLYPTYVIFEAEEFEVVMDANGNEVMSSYGLPKVNVKKFSKPRPLPYFLEGPARALKANETTEKAREIYRKVKETDLFDADIKMYKTSVSLNDEPHEIGRIKAFTPGWLERESVFLHMSYKYLLELLKSGLYEEYFNELQTSLIPFLDPKIYGRSTLENSSFIASSVNPDANTHGRGFVARLSGSTAEFLSMWKTMMIGSSPFQMYKGKLTFTLAPNLPDWLFKKNGELSFQLFGQTKVTYHNPKKLSTFGDSKVEVRSYELLFKDARMQTLLADNLEEKEALSIRNGEVAEIHVTLA
ncbi:cellobiose phosphorylase [Bacillus sp. 2205SS5-2]|uniref:cellobiose phosphorylase n=1 Tax=Bacillus sp. 2205SS5-2 TaxID=3109031 RepID=UPI003004720F